MESFLQTLTLLVAVISLSSVFGAYFSPALAAVVPSEGVPAKEEPPSSVTVSEPEPASAPQNPFDKSAKDDPYEAMRRKREKTTILIIVCVVVLLCAYWLTSGKLHHRFPR